MIKGLILQLSLENLENVLEEVNSNTLDLGYVKWIEPACITLLQSLHTKNNIGFSSTTKFTKNVNRYLERIFNAKCTKDKTYYPIENITTRANIDEVAKMISSVIVKEDHFPTEEDHNDFKDYLKYVLTEVMNNVCDHSQSKEGGYVTAQYYPTKNKVQIAIADTGTGFLYKLAKKFNDVTTEEEAIDKAVQKEITGSQPDIYGAERNAGYGLYVILKIVEMTGGTLKIVSNSTVATFHDGEKTVKHCATSWTGSIVAFDIQAEFIDSKLMDFLKDRIYVEEVEEVF